MEIKRQRVGRFKRLGGLATRARITTTRSTKMSSWNVTEHGASHGGHTVMSGLTLSRR